jgi:integrase
MARTTFTDRLVKSIINRGSTKDGKDLWDAVVPGLCIRNRGSSYVVGARFPGSPAFARRRLAALEALTLDEAREKARLWLRLIAEGKDPATEHEKLKRVEQQKLKTTFASVVQTYLNRKVIGPDSEKPHQRNGHEVAREINQVLIPLWGNRPITEITRADVKAVIEGVRDYGTRKMLATFGVKPPQRSHKRGRPASRQGKPAPGQARNLLGIIKTFFAWAVVHGDCGLESSPADLLKGKDLIGAKASADRFLSDIEVAAFWRVTGRMRYPYGELYQMLLLTGLRLNECADARWPEFDLKAREWTVPKERMKGTNHRARAHVVPLTPDMLAILNRLPRFTRGDHVFSVTFGESPVWANDKIKKRLDIRMVRSLRALARMRGEDPAKVKFAPWVNHDLRRTLRTGLSKLRIDHDIKEAVLAHAKVGLVGIYDMHDLLDEKRDALEQWGTRIRSIVTPPPDNVVTMPARA